jgi:hypothetical protein
MMEKKFPKEPMLQIFIAQYYITYKDSLNDAMVKMDQAQLMDTSLDEEFIIYRTRQLHVSDSADTLTHVRFSGMLHVAMKGQRIASRAARDFWNELMQQDKGNFHNVLKYSHIITK